jgi:predicted aspartyl protease
VADNGAEEKRVCNFMGLTFVEGTVQGPTGKKSTAQFLVDSGAMYTLLSPDHWKAIELTPKREMNFALADGTVVKRSMSECVISLAQGEAHTPVILGEEGDESLLGIVTLEILGLMLNPFHRTLEPMKMMLA